MRVVRHDRTLALLAGLVLWATPVVAQDLQDGQLWVQSVATVSLTPNWRAHLELQPRLINDASELGLTIVRTAIGRQVAPGVTLWLGHAWIPRTAGDETVHEQRIWQQLLMTGAPIVGWTPTVRARLEQRWLDPWTDASHRVRLLVRGQKPIGTSRTSIIVYDEGMYTFDTTMLGPPQGFDRNRLAALLGRRLSQLASIEAGYIWEHARLQGGGRRNDHVISAVINLTIPRPSS
jgi:hypothetical protein